MRAVVEEVNHQRLLRLADAPVRGGREPREFAVEPDRLQARRPLRDHEVHRGTRRAVVRPIVGLADGFPDRRRSRHSGLGEAVHPDAITPEQVIQRRLDRTEECASFRLPRRVLERIGRSMTFAFCRAEYRAIVRM